MVLDFCFIRCCIIHIVKVILYILEVLTDMGDQYLNKEKSSEPVFKIDEQKDEWAEETKKRFETQQKMFEQSQNFEATRSDVPKELKSENISAWDEKIETVKKNSPKMMDNKAHGTAPDPMEIEEDERLEKLEEDEKLKTEMKELGNRYDRLFSSGATDIDAKKVREDITDMICRLTGKELGDLEYLPTDKMDAIIRKNVKNVGKDNMEDLVSEDIKVFRDAFETEENNYAMFKGPIAELSAKSDMTVGEKLRLYEYSLCAVRYTTEMEDLQYNSLYDMRQDKLSSLAMDLLDFAESKNDSFTTMSEESREKHMAAASRLLASLSDEPEEIFRHMPFEELSDRTSSTFNMMLRNKEFVEKIKETVARAKALTKR